MAFKTAYEIIPRIIRRLAQVPGTGTQIYAEDRIAEILKAVYDQVAQVYWWPDLMYKFVITPDATTGIPTTDLVIDGKARVENYGDIREVFYNNYPRPIPQLPANISDDSIYAGFPGYVRSLNYLEDPGNRLFKLLPAPNGNVTLKVWARVTPLNVIDDRNVKIPIDEFILIDGVCFKYCAEDGHNPAMAEGFRQAYETKVQSSIDTYDSLPVPLDSRTSMIPGNWIDPDYNY